MRPRERLARRMCGNLQKAEAQHDRHAYLLLARDLEAGDETEGQRIRENVGEDVDGCVGEIEGVDVDALLVLVQDRDVVGGADGRALEDTGQDCSSRLAGDDAHHYHPETPQLLVP